MVDGTDAAQSLQLDVRAVDRKSEIHQSWLAGIGNGVPAGDETDVVAVPAKPAVVADAARGLDAVRAQRAEVAPQPE